MSKVVNIPLSEKLLDNGQSNNVARNSSILLSSSDDSDDSKDCLNVQDSLRVKPYNDHIFIDDNNNVNDKNEINDYSNNYSSIRDDHSAVYEYLKQYFIELTWIDILKLYVVNIGTIVVNVVFICYNFFVISYIDTTNQFGNKELKYSDIIVVYFEFIGLIVLFLSCLFTCYFDNYAAMCDFIPSLGNFSAFKLFYQFRPLSIIDYMTDIYQNNNSKRKDNKSTIAKSAMIFRTIWLFAVFLLCLFVGFLSLLIKLSQLTFIHDKWFHEYSQYEIIYLLGFSNQLWNMANENKIIIDSIFQFLYIDLVSFEINRDSQIKIMTMEAIIKQTLVKVHGIRGLFVSIGLNHKLLSKILKTIPRDHNRMAKVYPNHKPDISNNSDKSNSGDCNNNKDDSHVNADSDTRTGILKKIRALSLTMRNGFRQKVTKLKNYINFEMFFASKYESQCENIPLNIKCEWIKHNRNNDLVKHLKQKLNINISLNRLSNASCLFDWIASYGLTILGVVFFMFFTSCAVLSIIVVALGDTYNVTKDTNYPYSDDELHKCVHHYGGWLWVGNWCTVVLDCTLVFLSMMIWLGCWCSKIYSCCYSKCCCNEDRLSQFSVTGGLVLISYIVVQIIVFTNLLILGLSNHNSSNDSCWRYLHNNYSLLVISNAWCSTVYVILLCHGTIFLIILCVVNGLLIIVAALFVMTSMVCAWVFDVWWIGVLITFASEWDKFHTSSLSIMNQYSSCNYMLYIVYGIFVLHIISISSGVVRYLWTFIYVSRVGVSGALKSTTFVKYYKFTILFINYIIYGLIIILSLVVLLSIYVFSNDKKSYCYPYFKNGDSQSHNDPFTWLTSSLFISVLATTVICQTVGLTCLWIIRKVNDSQSHEVLAVSWVHAISSHYIDVYIYIFLCVFAMLLKIITCLQCDITDDLEQFSNKYEGTVIAHIYNYDMQHELSAQNGKKRSGS